MRTLQVFGEVAYPEFPLDTVLQLRSGFAIRSPPPVALTLVRSTVGSWGREAEEFPQQTHNHCQPQL